MSEYLLDRDRQEALRRLRLIERIQDPATLDHMIALGVDDGWQCLEVGAGGGSVALWLSDRVRPGGRVVATDLTIDILAEIERDNVEVRRHDAVADPFESGAYDLVHARNVLVHIPERDAVLEKLSDAVKPGGWLLLEEPDVLTAGPDPEADGAARALHENVLAAIHAFLQAKGLDTHLGSELLGRLRRLGFERLGSEGRVRVFPGGPGEITSPHMPAFAELREAIVGTGSVADEDYRAFLALADDPGFAWRESLTMTAWGRRPAGS